MEAVDRCWGCGYPVPPEDVAKTQKEGETVFLIWEHDCGMTGQSVMSAKAFERFSKRWLNYKNQGKDSPKYLGYDPEEIGILVAGFRDIDLASIETVDDLVIEWAATVPPMEKTVKQKWLPPQ